MWCFGLYLVSCVRHLSRNILRNLLSSKNHCPIHSDLHQAFKASSVLRDFVPQVHGYFEQDDVMGEPMSMLLMDRVAFTMAHLIEKMMAGPLSELAMNVMVTCVLNVVRRIAQAAQRGIMTHDWHVGNIAFHDQFGASAMFLVDFEKNLSLIHI